MNKARTEFQVTGSSGSTLPSKKKEAHVGGKSKAEAGEMSMSRSGEIQESKKSVAADDKKQTRKDRWKKAFVDKLSKVNQREYLSIYDPQKKRKIRGEVCIYRVPDKLRQVKDEAYRPSVVSIGPFHEKDRNLAAMAQYKLAYMLSFLDQQSKDPPDHSGDPRESHSRKSATKCLEDCIDAICGLDEVVRQCYAEDIDYTEDALAEILLLDGCFILELFFRFDRNLGYMRQEDYKSDPVLRSAWTIAALQHDLALLENQIPFFVLELLYDTIKPHVLKCKLPPSLTSLALKFFQPVSRKEMKEVPPAGATEFKHLLDLLHKFYFHPTGHLSIKVDQIISGNHNCSALQQVISSLLSKMKREKQPPSLTAHQSDPTSNGKWEFKYCASELLESGIEFKVGPNTQQHLLEITLEGGVMIIPQLHINETTSSLFRNLIAFEQCSLKSTHSVTSYAFLLKSLITTTGDSKLLGAREIIQHNNRIGHKEYLAQFESILDEVALKDDFCFGALFDQVNKFCMSWYSWSRIRVFLWVQFQRQKRILCTTYFSTTWKVISLMAAVFLLVVTSVQTYFTVYPR